MACRVTCVIITSVYFENIHNKNGFFFYSTFQFHGEHKKYFWLLSFSSRFRTRGDVCILLRRLQYLVIFSGMLEKQSAVNILLTNHKKKSNLNNNYCYSTTR
jgi:hypothetical protein